MYGLVTSPRGGGLAFDHALPHGLPRAFETRELRAGAGDGEGLAKHDLDRADVEAVRCEVLHRLIDPEVQAQTTRKVNKRVPDGRSGAENPIAWVRAARAYARSLPAPALRSTPGTTDPKRVKRKAKSRWLGFGPRVCMRVSLPVPYPRLSTQLGPKFPPSDGFGWVGQSGQKGEILCLHAEVGKRKREKT